MKTSFLLAGCILIAMQSYALKKDPSYRNARRNGAMAKMELRITNDDGAPIPYANVDVFMGMNFRSKGYSITGRTDTNGIFVVKGKTCGDEIVVNIAKAGFYRTAKTFKFAEMGHEHEVSEGHWQPYGKRENIVLRDIRHPIELSHENFWNFKYTKALNTWIGYDIKENDFVAPNGKGKVADFEVYIDWNGEWIPTYTGMAVEIRFADPFSGYYETPANTESSFIGPYKAEPAANYAQNAKFSEQVRGGGEIDESHFNKSNCWVVRSRCKVNEKGELVSANYTVIHDITFACKKGRIAGFSIIGFFNPTPNDTNLEAKQ